MAITKYPTYTPHDKSLFWFDHELDAKFARGDTKVCVDTLIMEKHDYLLRLKNEIELFYQPYMKSNQWNQMTYDVFPFSKITNQDTVRGGKPKINRAYHKMKEMLHYYGVPPVKTALCLCEAPGGFVQALCEHSPNVRWTAVSLVGSIRFSNILKRRYHGLVVYQDILRNPVKLPCKVDLVTGDGGFDTSDAYDAQESLTVKLIEAEIKQGCENLNVGGTMIIKMFDIYTEATCDAILHLISLFEKVNICKPPCSKPSNAEKYVICRGYGGTFHPRDSSVITPNVLNWIIHYSTDLQINTLSKCLSELWIPSGTDWCKEHDTHRRMYLEVFNS